jgi:hypothetical protein
VEENSKTNTLVTLYKTIKEGKNRCVVKVLKVDKFNFDTPNEGVVMVCYDIETHTRLGFDGMKIHSPYIVEFVDNIDGKFQYFAGIDCIEQFIRHLQQFRDKSKVYLNAFNGSRFEHYEFVKKLNKMYEDDASLKLDKLVFNNGAILKANVGNIECSDISKHITGTLRQNLEELGCLVQKGEFDYNLGDEWENMSKESQTACITYLKADVLGLKELSERLNKSCFENFSVNLYKYISTSQLTYDVWVHHRHKPKNR